MKRVILAILVVFVLWSVLDFVVHGLILAPAYQKTASLWRPMGEMKTGLYYLTVLISAIVFVSLYALFFARRGVWTALAYGFIFGLGAGISMGYGTYSFMPIPYHMALTWFLGTLAKITLGGICLGLIVRKV